MMFLGHRKTRWKKKGKIGIEERRIARENGFKDSSAL